MTTVGVVGFWHETNAYSARRPGMRQWRDYELLEGDAIVAAHGGTRSVLGGFLHALGDRAIPVVAAGAWPAGATPRADLDELLSRLTERLRAAGPLDGIALNLHGATVAEGCDDVEAEVARRVRDVCGDIPIAAVLDLHGNPSVDLVAAVDAVIGYRTYPHVDMWECGVEAVELLDRMLEGESLATSIAKIPLLTCPLVQGTEDGALGRVLADATADAAARGVTRVSVLAGFAYQDVERAGMSVLAVVSRERAAEAEAVVNAAVEAIEEADRRGEFIAALPNARDAVASALASPDRPVVIADVADNIGGGSAGDGTVVLAELLAQGAQNALAVIADAEVVAAARSAGEGGVIEVELGGKTDNLHGPPLPVRAHVRRLGDGGYTSHGSWGAGLRFEMGATAVLDVAGNTVVVTERATPPFHREQVTSVGVDPGGASVILAKGALAWRAAYGDLARVVIEVDAPGACPVDPWSLPRERRPVRVAPAVTPRWHS